MAASGLLRKIPRFCFMYNNRYILPDSLLSKSKLVRKSTPYASLSSGTDDASDENTVSKADKLKKDSSQVKKKHEKLTSLLADMKVQHISEKDDEPVLYADKFKDENEIIHDPELQRFVKSSFEDSFVNDSASESVIHGNEEFLSEKDTKMMYVSENESKITDESEKFLRIKGTKKMHVSENSLEQMNKNQNIGGSQYNSDKEQKVESKIKETVIDAHRIAASQKLSSLLNTMKIDSIPRDKSSISLKLAIPEKRRPKRKLSEEETLRESAKSALDENLLHAAKDVANNLGGDVKQTESELMRKLLDHAIETKEGKLARESGANLSDIVLGMKVDRTKKAPRMRPYQERQNFDRESDTISRYIDVDESTVTESMRDVSLQYKQRRTRPALVDSERVNLFDTSLNLFPSEPAKKYAGVELKTWKKLQDEELQLRVKHPPANAFEEMIRWTEEGKFWTFPIDNEAGLEEEKKVGFHEHVFLEGHLEGFPKKGPVRQFMNLVIIGLSKNSYITVQRKKEHIEWFRQYFKEKEDLLRETGALIEDKTILDCKSV